MRTIRKLLAIAATIVLLAPAGAVAQSGSEGYGGDNSVVSGLEQGDQAQQAGDDDGGLPLTGRDLVIVVAAGGVLLVFGVGLRQLTHRA